MKKILTLITVISNISACTHSDNQSVSNATTLNNDKAETKLTDTIERFLPVDSLVIERTDETVDTTVFDVYKTFSKKKEAIALQLSTCSAEEANELYEQYFLDNLLLITQITNTELPILDRFYSDEAIDKKNIVNLTERLTAYDLEFDEMGEGYVEVKTTPNFYYNLFNTYVSSDYKDFLYIRSEENKTRYQADAGLMISFKALGKRIITWETFIEKHANSVLLKQVKDVIKVYQMDYLIGMDNTPTIEWGKEAYIYPENVEEFNRFKAEYPNSPTVNLITYLEANFKNDDFSTTLREELNKL